MKKSEPIKVIQDYLQDLIFWSEFTNDNDLEKEAIIMLEKLEHLGMLPPVLPDRQGQFDGVKTVMNFCKWEPEDD